MGFRESRVHKNVHCWPFIQFWYMCVCVCCLMPASITFTCVNNCWIREYMFYFHPIMHGYIFARMHSTVYSLCLHDIRPQAFTHCNNCTCHSLFIQLMDDRSFSSKHRKIAFLYYLGFSTQCYISYMSQGDFYVLPVTLKLSIWYLCLWYTLLPIIIIMSSNIKLHTDTGGGLHAIWRYYILYKIGP